ncbi:Hypothetical predicted protein [Marmota monax]|nr:Hypothetical predicted protein [Marmota monax]
MTVDGVGYYSHEILGSQAFDICVRDLIPVDVPEHFRGRVSIWATVTSVDGGQQVAFDDSTPVQRQLVDIRYSRDTRRQFKPGLAYVGKVELSYPDGSPAEGVTVQVKAELMPRDNIYTREFVSQGGLVWFEIPSIPMSAQRVWLETKVTALDGKPVGAQYLPSYLALGSWYSPSQCHLQLQPPSRPLQIGEEARFSVHSTCPCNFTLYYEVAARGNIVLSGQQPAHITLQRSRRAAPAPEKPIRLTHLSETAAEVNVCVTSLRLAVTPSMVPLGRLLVLYVREDGEGVTDSLQFAVENYFENQVSLTYSANETRPGEVVDLRVRAARGSCVCIAAVDRSVYLLGSGFRLTPAQVFRELEDYDVSDAFGVSREDGASWWAGLTARRRRRSSAFPWPWGVTKDSGFAFTVRRGGLVFPHCLSPAPELSRGAKQHSHALLSDRDSSENCVFRWLCAGSGGCSHTEGTAYGAPGCVQDTVCRSWGHDEQNHLRLNQAQMPQRDAVNKRRRRPLPV